ncbi:MAG: putative peptidoglycan D,D-transpeptidase PenA [Planctomycetes bacterium]|nr:putative peptidoglycan D,D-transpeptidase PenA [Planctomycetota bacterium]
MSAESGTEQLRLRSLFGFGLVLGAFGLLTVRLAWIQLGTHHVWEGVAESQHFSRRMPIPAERGRITDRNGRVLVQSERFPSVAVDPKLVPDGAVFARLVERCLGVPHGKTLETLGRGKRFQWIARQVRDRAAVDRLRQACATARIGGLIVREEPKRTYPYGSLAAHVLGATDRDGNGLEGIERIHQARLAGTPGSIHVMHDALGNPVETSSFRRTEPVHGDDVRLTLDLTIQSFCEEAADSIAKEHRPMGLSVAVLHVRTGEILGLACRPTFDPNDPSGVPVDSRRARFFTDSYEPGSVFKPIMMAAALDAGVVKATETFTCNNGETVIGKRRIHEDKQKSYGTLDCASIIAYSSNTGMAQIGDRLGIDGAKRALRAFGFGAKTSVGWPGETTGDVQANRRWSRSDQLASVSFGHAMTASPAQILQAYGILANGGERIPMRLVLDIPADSRGDARGDAGGDDRASGAGTPPAAGPDAFACSPETAAALAPMLEAVLEGKGTAAYVYKEKDYRIGGKTGTAQNLRTGGHISSFACYGPVEAPELAVLVIAEDPKAGIYGSKIGASRAVPILRQSLRVLGVPIHPEPRPLKRRPVPAKPEAALPRAGGDAAVGATAAGATAVGSTAVGSTAVGSTAVASTSAGTTAETALAARDLPEKGASR